MQTISLRHPRSYWNLALRLLGLLLILQGARSALTFGLWKGFGLPERANASAPELIWIDLAAFAVMGGLLLLLVRPSAADLALDLRASTRGGLIFTGLIGLLFAALLVISFVMFPDQILSNVRAALVIPFIEELIFRGCLWSAIRKSTDAPEWMVYGIVTIVFGAWHLGYADSVLRTAAPGMNIGFILLMKLVIGTIVGALAGLARWRTKNIYAAMIMHGLWNLFGR